MAAAACETSSNLKNGFLVCVTMPCVLCLVLALILNCIGTGGEEGMEKGSSLAIREHQKRSEYI